MNKKQKETDITASMRIDIIAGLDAKVMMDRCPELKKISAFVDYMQKGNGNADFRRQVIAYIVLLYSKDSILNVEPIPRLQERQLKAGELVKFKKNTAGEFNTEVVDVLFHLERDFYQRMVLEFTLWQNDMLWEQIVVNEHYRASLMKEMISVDLDDKAKDRTSTLAKKKDLRIEIDNITKYLIEKYNEVFKDVEVLKKPARQELIMTTLEKIAE